MMFPPPVRRLFLLLGTLCAAATSAADSPPILEHRAAVRIDVDAHTVLVSDRLTVPAGLAVLRLGPAVEVLGITLPAGTAADPAAALRPAEDEDGPYQELDLAALGLGDAPAELLLETTAAYFQSVAEVVFSRENVGGEISATIGDEGVYLSAGAGWLAWSPDCLAVHDLELDTPAGWETVTQGARVRHETVGDRLLTRWSAPDPSDGLTLVANRFVVHQREAVPGVTAYTFFLADEPDLRETYLERTTAYLEMYQEMIGPYPYAKFATVENWFPTGYGMPSYTLLGGQVLRLPFIPTTSFGHEICHNWWGNSIFIDFEQGNWCEGLTVYCADYHYKELESAAAAHEYRRTLLKDYDAYLQDPENDFPLAEFRSRHSGATRAVGYGKSMMVFHMLERRIGREAFAAGLRAVAADFRFRKAAWSDFLAAFAAASGQDLGVFAQQWLQRTGAPVLRLDEVEFAADRVRFRLSQDDPPYALRVPVVVTGDQGPAEHLVTLDAASARFELPATGPRRLEIDPDHHLFRRLDPREVEPTLSRVLADPAPVFVLDGAAGELAAAAREFAAGFSEQEAATIVADGILPRDLPPAQRHANVVINPGSALLAGYRQPDLTVAGRTVVLGGRRYDLQEMDLVFAADNPLYPEVTDLVILSRSPERLAQLASRLGHYGKYSWLLLPAGQGRPLRGNWPPAGSPLTAENP